MAAARRPPWLAIGLCAGAAVGVPAGIWLGQPAAPVGAPEPRPVSGTERDIFSPTPRSDPQVLDAWRRTVEAMEAGCRASGSRCAEAHAARRRLIELQSGR